MPKKVFSLLGNCCGNVKNTNSARAVTYSDPKYNEPDTEDEEKPTRRGTKSSYGRRKSTYPGNIQEQFDELDSYPDTEDDAPRRSRRKTGILRRKMSNDYEDQSEPDFYEEPPQIVEEPKDIVEQAPEKEKPTKCPERSRFTESASATASSQTDRSVDIIIYGATGALGSYTVLHAVSILAKFKWGIAGRNRRNLEAVLRNVGAITEKNCDNIPIYIANASDKEALVRVTQDCKLIVNCCGPYEEYAGNIIEACIAANTHYVDASFEPSFLKTLRAQFHIDAELEQVYVINSCGFMSFVMDVGLNFIERNFSGTLDTVEAYTQFCRLGDSHILPIFNCATWNSIVNAMSNARQLIIDTNLEEAPLRVANKASACFCAALNGCIRPRLPRLPIGRTDGVTGVSIPLPLIDAQAVKVSQEFISMNEDKPQVQFKNYLTFPTYFNAILAFIWCIVLFVLSQTPGTRDLLLKYPRLFSLGMCTNSCLDKDAVDQLVFSITFKAKGQAPPDNRVQQTRQYQGSRSPSPTCTTMDDSVEPVEKTQKVKICAMNPFFGIGCVSLLASAITVLKQTKDLPGRGGVFTPGAAFRNTKILQELSKHNPRFKYKVL